uniref:Uncharacterized protein n=1 Tax=Amphora coffeiformis TaxID=265554 RepID=A0A6S8IR77_9STRA|eukprot:scaffold1488_cov141-Amphora_coffeaeformis.AAC.13
MVDAALDGDPDDDFLPFVEAGADVFFFFFVLLGFYRDGTGRNEKKQKCNVLKKGIDREETMDAKCCLAAQTQRIFKERKGKRSKRRHLQVTIQLQLMTCTPWCVSGSMEKLMEWID